MPQVKKSAVNDSILKAAFELFSAQGYQATSMPDIASRAGVTAGNIYRYHKSKFELLYAVLEPWLDAQLSKLERELLELEDRQAKLRKILVFMWVELPRAGNNFEINLMEALATKKPSDVYSRKLLQESEARIRRLLEDVLPDISQTIVTPQDMAHLIFMAHDGFVLSANLTDESEGINEMIDRLTLIAFAPRKA